MRIAFVGKGGSGKSTASWLFSSFLASNDEKVLAIDADYNLDLLHNFHLTEKDVPHFVNSAEKDFYSYLNLSQEDYYVDLPLKKGLPQFTLSPADWFTEKYTLPVVGSEGIQLMVTGMVPQEMLYGHRCGHAYISSLKYYLPLLQSKKDEHVVVDAVAGTDLVSYGMFLGCDAVVVVVEETPHSVGVFEQISAITQTFTIPTFAVLNKYRNTARLDDFVAKHKDVILGKIPFDDSIIDYTFATVSDNVLQSLDDMYKNLNKNDFDDSLRWQRHIEWREKYGQQQEENKSKDFQFLES